MATEVPNPRSESNAVVTRLRKRRDLETTMNTLKQLLEPKLTITTKSGSRKKNKPRSLPKKVVLPKKVNPIEICSEGEYYPNKMKRKVRLKKTVLKPRHDLKIIMATNKRKRGIPHKGLESLEEESLNHKYIEERLDAHTETSNDVEPLKIHTECKIKVDTDFAKVNSSKLQLPATNPDKYKLISPPHKSLTEMTVDDLIRMDEDSLSDENLMEILTCPSPVWWEDPEECAGHLFLTSEETEISTTNIAIDAKHVTHFNNILSMRKTHSVSEVKSKGNKIAKLETILGHIKSLGRTDNTLVHSDSDIVPNDSVDSDSVTKINYSYDEAKLKEIRTCEFDIPKRRTISSSGSEISVNEDDLLRNLESINIPIQGQRVDGDASDLQKDTDDKTFNVNDHEMIPIIYKDNLTCNDVENEFSKVNESDETGFDKVYATVKDKKHYQRKYSNKNKRSNTLLDLMKKTPEPKNQEKAIKSKTENILKRLQKENDDILDVRLIKTPTNVTNEVQVWSKLDNFKLHNFKPQDFVSEVIDVEDELEFSMIENSPVNEHRMPKSKSETILIDDDSNDPLDDNTMLKVNDTINIDNIEQCSDVTIATIIENNEVYESCEISKVNHSKDTLVDGKCVIKENTLSIGNDSGIRIIKTAGILQDVSVQPKQKRKRAAGLKLPRKTQTKNLKKLKESCEGIKILPMEAITNATSQPLISCQAEISYQYFKKRSHRNEHLNKRKIKKKIAGVIDSSDANDTILCLDGVDVSLVKNPVSKTDSIKINDNHVKQNDLSITLVETIPMTATSTKAVCESSSSVKSEHAENTVGYSEGMISDMNIRFMDEYESNNSKVENLEGNSQKTSEELDIEFRKDLIIVKHLAEDKNVTDIDMEHDGVNCGVKDFDEGGKTIEIQFIDEENSKSVGEVNNREIDDSQQANSEETKGEKITPKFHEVNQMVEHSLEIKENEEEEIKQFNSFDVDKNENTNPEELVTIYQIVNSNSENDNVDARDLKSIKEEDVDDSN